MTNKVLTWLENEWSQLKSSTAVKTATADAENIGGAGWAFIKTNGLHDLYQIALTLVAAAIPGASWTGILASIEAQAVVDGKQLLQGYVAVVAATAQADLIASGKLAAPSSAPNSV